MLHCQDAIASDKRVLVWPLRKTEDATRGLVGHAARKGPAIIGRWLRRACTRIVKRTRRPFTEVARVDPLAPVLVPVPVRTMPYSADAPAVPLATPYVTQ